MSPSKRARTDSLSKTKKDHSNESVFKCLSEAYCEKHSCNSVKTPSVMQNAGKEHADTLDAGKEYEKKMLAKEVMHPSLMNCEKVNTGIKDADGMKTAGKAFSILKTGEMLQTSEMYSDKGDKTEKCLNNMSIQHNGKEQIKEHGKNESSGEMCPETGGKTEKCLNNMSIQHNGKEQIKEHGKNESSGEKTIASQYDKDVNILWFRNGIRLHDNGSLHNALQNTKGKLLPIFIFDGETPTTNLCGYNKIKFLLECLEDVEQQFQEAGGKLYFLQGKPVKLFRILNRHFNLNRICFDQDIEPIWLERDNAVKDFCISKKIDVFEHIGATLWDPLEIIEANGGTPPLTYAQFCHVTRAIDQPPRPKEDIDLKKVNFVELSETLLEKLNCFPSCPSAEDLGYKWSGEKKVYKGGERLALKYFNRRVISEKEAFIDRSFLPNRHNPDILCPPKSLSPDLKFGCLSIKKFYWEIIDAFEEVNKGSPPACYLIVSQLIWREFFYTMSANNPFFGEIERNPVCIDFPWYKDDEALSKLSLGMTGYPFIDAGVRQMRKEGWTHHIVRNAISMFLTRGDLWLSWEHGVELFMIHMIDADWAVTVGNWMWVSSSAFERALNCSYCLDPRTYGKEVDPDGAYIKKFVPELANFPAQYVYAPWTAPLEEQEKASCIIGKMILQLQKKVLSKYKREPDHIKPSDESEINTFFRI